MQIYRIFQTGNVEWFCSYFVYWLHKFYGQIFLLASCPNCRDRLFSEIHKIGNFGILFYLFKNKLDTRYQSHTSILIQHDECEFPLKLIQLATIFNLFPIIVVLVNCQHWQL